MALFWGGWEQSIIVQTYSSIDYRLPVTVLMNLKYVCVDQVRKKLALKVAGIIMLSRPEVDTLSEMLLSGYRLDGRSLTEYREINFRFPRGKESDVTGCCVVKIGATSVMAQVSTEIVEPKHFRPSQGMLFVNFDTSLLHLSRNLYRRQSRDDEGRRLSAVLQTLLRDSIDLDALCIVAWERVFAVRVELRALSYDGNLGDCGALAAVAALAAFRRPDVFVDDGGKVIVDIEAKHRPRVPLSIRRVPVLVTLGLNSDAKVVLIDPSGREEFILTGGRVMLGFTGFSEICCLYTTGLSVPIQSSSLSRCIHLANSKARSLVALVRQVMEGLSLQREAVLNASHARSSDICTNIDQSFNAPLVLSTVSFLPDEVNNFAQGDFVREEGEILPDDLKNLMDSDTDMDIVSSEEETFENKHKENQNVSKILPYGVIEIHSSNTINESNKYDQPLYSVDFSDAFDTPQIPIQSNSEIITSHLGKFELNKISRSKVGTLSDQDEEETVTILNL